MLSTESALAKYSLYYYRYHLNQPLAAGLEKPLQPTQGLSPLSWQLHMGGTATQKTVDDNFLWDMSLNLFFLVLGWLRG